MEETTVLDPALARLVAEQARDDARDALPAETRAGRRVIREADLAPRRRRRADLGRVDADQARDHQRRPSKFRGRSRRVAIRADDGAWHDTEATGSRVGFWVLLLGCTPWESVVQAAVDVGACECPACHDLVNAPAGPGQPSRSGHICLFCNRSGLDGKADFHGYKPDTVLNPCWEEFQQERDLEARKAKERGQTRRAKVRGGLGK